ncbi:SDR family NAD(P)-dependent oxidoreductase [Paenibacillus sp. KS-LC4]|uniref:SDR family NAD(P)-dependent oxidoreductase n=1 Tax=Paenibacillus sp. KS-LC4 TaxID=2979727 RepID=UPI0030D5FE18
MNNTNIVFISGANRGLGKEIALRLGKRGMTVLLGCRDISKGKMVEQMISDLGGISETYPFDLRDPRACYLTIKQIEKKYNYIDILINNAGVFSHENDDTIDTITDQLMEEMVAVNMLGPLRSTRDFLPLLLRSQAGKIINITSDLADFNSMDGLYNLYRMTKTALNAMTVNVGAELKDTKVKIYGLDPGWMNTDMGGAEGPQTPMEVSNWVEWVLDLQDSFPSGTVFYEYQIAKWWNINR